MMSDKLFPNTVRR